MARHNETGKRGEALALAHFQQKGYEILAQNWRFSRAEVDIVAKDGGCLVFAEVKARRTALFGHPAAFVTPKKRRFLADAAQEYMRETGYEWTFRFDIIAIVLIPGASPRVEHYPDAFFPGLV